MFVNREKELSELSVFHERAGKEAQMVVIYGRRRIGKTSLVKEFLKGRRGIYLFIEPKSQELLFREAEEILAGILNIKPHIGSWEGLFNICKKERLVLVLDEFQNLVRIDKNILFEIQRIWDGLKDGPGPLFIPVGSYVGMIKNIFRDSKQPLFGRANGMMRLGPLDIISSMGIMSRNGLDINEGLKYYSVFGGVPRYLIELTKDRDMIREMVHGTSSFLREEGINILTMEFGSQHRGYFSVLESISRGKCTPLEISHDTGMNQATVSKYLGELEKEYELVKGDGPVTVKNFKLVRYRITDPFLSFWFRYIFSRASRLEIDPDRVLSDIEEELPQVISRAMEKITGDLIIQKKELISPTAMGRWWSRKGEEIDIVAVDEDTDEILFAEVKWRNRPVGIDIHEELVRKSKLVQWRKSKRKERYLIVSKSGFTNGLIQMSKKDDGLYLWDMKEIEKMIHHQRTHEVIEEYTFKEIEEGLERGKDLP